MKKFIAYYRVSTKDQGESGLGLEAQKMMVERFIESEKNRSKTHTNPIGSPMCLFAEFTDVETGKYNNPNREGLNNAIGLCRHLLQKKQDVILLIAKLDRLSRNLHFITSLQESNIKFICCDMPNADNTTIHIFGAIAQREAEMISSRTKDALAAFKEKNKDGFVDRRGNFRTGLGNPQNLTNEARKKGSKIIQDRSRNNEDNIRAVNYGKVLYEKGLTYSEVATRLNKDGFRTSTGGLFCASQVNKLIKKFGKEEVGS